MAQLSYRHQRFPAEIIQQAIWLYLRFTLSYRDVEELLAERGLDVSYETVRRWVLKFGPLIARNLRQGRPRPSARWHLDGVSRTHRRRMRVWSCTRDEGGPLDAGGQAQASNHCKLLSLRAMVVSVAAKGGTTSRQVWSGEASESEPLMTCRNAKDDVETGGASSFRDEFGSSPGGCPSGIRHIGGAKPDPSANRIRTTLNKATGKLDIRQLHHATDVILPDGRKARQVTVDERDRDQIPKIMQRERKRHGLPPLSKEALAAESKKVTVAVLENPLVQVTINVSFAYLRHAMTKIAYELAFLWLGESYLDDPLAVELREAICKEDLASTDELAGYVGEAEPCTAFRIWTPHEAPHLAFASIVANTIVVAARVFDVYEGVIVVSREPSRYVRSAAASSKLRFLAIDSVSGNTIDTTFDAEIRRMAAAMTAHRRLPPFPDPLSPPPDEPRQGSS